MTSESKKQGESGQNWLFYKGKGFRLWAIAEILEEQWQKMAAVVALSILGHISFLPIGVYEALSLYLYNSTYFSKSYYDRSCKYGLLADLEL